jgi:exopolysaccharide biosynthesis polyprenyl glycosylphosphotransferase
LLHRHDRFTAALLVAGDLVLSFAAVALAYQIRFGWKLYGDLIGLPEPIPSFFAYLPFALTVVVTTVAVFAAGGLYTRRRLHGRYGEFFAIVKNVSLVLVIAYGAKFFIQTEMLSRWLMTFFWAIDIVFVGVFRAVVRRLGERVRRRGVDLRRVLVVGTGPLGQKVAEKLKDHTEYGYELAGFLGETGGAGSLGGYDDLAKILTEVRPDEVFIAVPAGDRHRLLEFFDVCEREGINASVVPDLMEVLIGRSINRAQIEDMDGIPLIGVRQVPLLSLWSRFLKRAFDLVLSVVVVLAFSWLYVLTALLVLVSSPGPIIFKQRRVGLNLAEFTFLKFRTMYVQSERESDTVWTERDDPRVTPIGRFLRRFSLDELPQFFNVIRGDMSIVGPRAERPHFVEEFKEKVPRFLVRHQVKAGITGWAQINGRYDMSIEDKVEYDIYYIENWSLAFDMRIILETLWRVVTGKGAY